MIMKKFLRVPALAAAIMTSLVLLAGCSQTASDKTAQQVYDAIQSAFKETYGVEAIPNSPVEVDDTTLEQKFHLAPDDVESYAGAVAGMMTNCDELVVVQAKKVRSKTSVKRWKRLCKTRKTLSVFIRS